MILQSLGFLMPYWISWDECAAQGLFYFISYRYNVNESCYGSGEYVSKPTLILEAVSFAIHLLVCMILVHSICSVFRIDFDEGSLRRRQKLALALIPVAGALSIAGCINLRSLDLSCLSNYSYGGSYSLCLASGIGAFCLISLLCCQYCCIDEDGRRRSVSALDALLCCRRLTRLCLRIVRDLEAGDDCNETEDNCDC